MPEISAGLITNKEMATIRKSLPKPNNPSKKKQTNTGKEEAKNKEEEADLNRPGGDTHARQRIQEQENKRGGQAGGSELMKEGNPIEYSILSPSDRPARHFRH